MFQWTSVDWNKTTGGEERERWPFTSKVLIRSDQCSVMQNVVKNCDLWGIYSSIHPFSKHLFACSCFLILSTNPKPNKCNFSFYHLQHPINLLSHTGFQLIEISFVGKALVGVLVVTIQLQQHKLFVWTYKHLICWLKYSDNCMYVYYCADTNWKQLTDQLVSIIFTNS